MRTNGNRISSSAARSEAPKVFLFMGSPGSGKGTQSAWLSSRLNVPILSTGEILRSESRRDTPAAFRLRQVLGSGALVDDDLVCAVVGSRLRRDVPERGVILDGFPRTVKQAAFLDCLLADLGLPRPCVIHLQVSATAILNRLASRRHCAKCGAIYNLVSRRSLCGSRCEIDGGALVQRDDDREGVILRRLADYEKASAPLVRYYSAANYHAIHGDRDPEVVLEDLLGITSGKKIAAPGLVAAFGD